MDFIERHFNQFLDSHKRIDRFVMSLPTPVFGMGCGITAALIVYSVLRAIVWLFTN